MCTTCILVDVLPLEGEFEEDVRQRREELEGTIQQLEGERVEGIVCARE